MKRTFKSLLAIASLCLLGLASMVIATPAQATVTCTLKNTGTLYPTATSNAWLCGPTNPNRESAVWIAVSSLPTIVRNRLQSDNVDIYYFNNRIEANDYFAHTAPFNNIAWIGQYTTSAGRCGDTNYSPVLRKIVVAIYDNCLIGNAQPPGTPSVSLQRATVHEIGHAYDYAIGDQHGGSDADVVAFRPSHRPGFTTLLNTDRTQFTPFNWSTYSPTSKVFYICGWFSSGAPDALEIDLGATPGAVCSNSTTANGNYGTMDPKAIAIEKAPYFVNKQEEAFAEDFVIEMLGSGSPAGFLPLVDRILGSYISPVRAMNCTRRTVNIWGNQGRKPTDAELLSPGAGNPSSCPQVSSNL